MELKSLFCPNCGASLSVDDGIDTFFCQYCGHRIFVQGQSKAAYEARVQVKRLEQEERLQDKKNAQERYRMEFKKKDERFSYILIFGLLGLMMAVVFVILSVGNNGAKQQERELQAIVDEIMVDIENEDFASAYVKANSLYWDDSWTSDGVEKWDATRKEVIKQIEEAEKKATGTTTNTSDEDSNGGGLFGWLD